MAEASSSYPIRISRDFESTSSDSSLGYCALKFSHNPPSLQQQAESSSPHRGVLHRGASPSSSSSKADWLLEYPRKSSASSSSAAHVFTATQSQNSSQQGHTDVLLIWDEKSKSYVLELVRGSVTLRYQRGKSMMSAPGVAILDKLAGKGKHGESNRTERSVQEQPRRSRQEASPIEADDLDDEAPASKKRRRLVEDQPGLALPSGSRAATPQSGLVLPSSSKEVSRSDEEEDDKRSSMPSQRSNEAPVGLGLDLNDDFDQSVTRSSTSATRPPKGISHATAARTERVATPGASETVLVASRISPPEQPSSKPAARSAIHTDAKDQDITSSSKANSDKDSNKASHTAAATTNLRGTTPAPAVLTPVLRASTSTLPVPSSPLVPLSRSTSSTTTTSWRPPAHHRNLSEGGSGIAIGTGVTSEDEDEEDEDEDEDDEDEEEDESEGDGDLEDFARQLEEELAGV